jgi:hypothetical protein
MTGARLASADLRLLLAEIATGRDLLERIAKEIEDVRGRHPLTIPREPLALLALDLHSYYTKLEALVERILLSFEGHFPRDEAEHAGLVRISYLAIPGIRPAIFSEPVRDALDELRRFRDFFRHGYSLDLRADKLECALAPFLTAHRRIDGDLGAFVQFIEMMVGELEA